MLNLRILLVVTAVALGMTTNDQKSTKPSFPLVYGSNPPIKELQGKAVPQRMVKTPFDLADWDSLWVDDTVHVKKLRIYGFDAFNGKGRTPIDITITDKRVLRTIEHTLNYILRPGVSDVTSKTDRGGGGAGGGAYMAVLQLDIGSRKVIIGVSQFTFYLGVWSGNPRQAFCSWALAKTIDDLLMKATDRHLPKHVFDNLSGLSFIEANRSVYYREMSKAK